MFRFIQGGRRLGLGACAMGWRVYNVPALRPLSEPYMYAYMYVRMHILISLHLHIICTCIHPDTHTTRYKTHDLKEAPGPQ